MLVDAIALESAIASAWERHAQAVKISWPGGCGGYIFLQSEKTMARLSFEAAVREVVLRLTFLQSALPADTSKGPHAG